MLDNDPLPETTAEVRSTKWVQCETQVHSANTSTKTMTQPQPHGPPETACCRGLGGGVHESLAGFETGWVLTRFSRAAAGALGPAPARRRAPPARAEGSEQNATLIYTQNDFVSHCARSCSALWG